MDVQATTTDGAYNGYAPLQSQMIDKSDFLRLLVNQVQHQDPLNPMSNEEFVGQLTQFSILEQNQNLNSTVQALMQRGDMQYAASLVGRHVVTMSGETTISGRVESITFVDGAEPRLTINGQQVPLSAVIEVTATTTEPATEEPVVDEPTSTQPSEETEL